MNAFDPPYITLNTEIRSGWFIVSVGKSFRNDLLKEEAVIGQGWCVTAVCQGSSKL